MPAIDRWRTRGLAALIGLYCVQAATHAHAGAVAAVVLLRSIRGPQRAMEDRTRDELRLLGIRVDEVSDPRGDADIGRLIAEHGAFAAVRIEVAGICCDAVTWYPGDSSDETPTVQRYTDGPGEPALIALRTAEALRHRALALGQASGSDDEVPPTPGAELMLAASAGPGRTDAGVIPPPTLIDTSSITSRHDATLRLASWQVDELDASAPATAQPRALPTVRSTRERWLGLSLAVAGGPGGGRSLLGAALTFGWRVVSVLTLQAELAAVASPVSVSTAHGSLEVGLASAQILCALGLPGDRRFMPRLRVGGGPVLAWTTGRGPSMRDEHDLGAAAVVTGGAGLVIRARPRLHLNIGVDIHIFVPPIRVRVFGAEEARLGPPLVRGTLGLAWMLPGRNRPVLKI